MDSDEKPFSVTFLHFDAFLFFSSESARVTLHTSFAPEGSQNQGENTAPDWNLQRTYQNSKQQQELAYGLRLKQEPKEEIVSNDGVNTCNIQRLFYESTWYSMGDVS